MRRTKEQLLARKQEINSHVEKMKAIYAENARIWSVGICPDCGGKLKRNLSLTGWVQCEQLGAVGFRKDLNKESCGFQMFLER